MVTRCLISLSRGGADTTVLRELRSHTAAFRLGDRGGGRWDDDVVPVRISPLRERGGISIGGRYGDRVRHWGTIPSHRSIVPTDLLSLI